LDRLTPQPNFFATAPGRAALVAGVGLLIAVTLSQLELHAAAPLVAPLASAFTAYLLFRAPPAELEMAVEWSRRAIAEPGFRADVHAPGLAGVLAANLNMLTERSSSPKPSALPVAAPVAAPSRSSHGDGDDARAVKAVLQEAQDQAHAQGASLDDTSAAMAQMAASVRTIASSVESLAGSAEESGSSILEMSAINEEMADNIQELASAVEETAASIEEMIYSIKEVAKNIEDLALAAEQTSTSMNEMEASINQVEQNATATARLSEDVIRDAERGADAVKRTLLGIEEIRASSRVAGDVIRQLGDRTAAIGNILNVIDDVAEQTNLLALNAAIIAAQAGEHGRGFAVVADEIKDLAERTGASTKEIAELIRGVQDQSRNAVAAISKGERSVEAGVQLSQAAEGALSEIVNSAGKATEMVKAIALATVEQSQGSKIVADAVDRIARTVQQVAAATAEQARGSEQIMRSTERMKTISTHVELSSQEQSKGSKQIAKSIEHINEMVRQLHQAQSEQARGSEQLLAAVEQLRASQFKQIEILEKA
jgi:methyl-accepting chemotaxis protein